jgi:hypothetical protein
MSSADIDLEAYLANEHRYVRPAASYVREIKLVSLDYNFLGSVWAILFHNPHSRYLVKRPTLA